MEERLKQGVTSFVNSVLPSLYRRSHSVLITSLSFLSRLWDNPSRLVLVIEVKSVGEFLGKCGHFMFILYPAISLAGNH